MREMRNRPTTGVDILSTVKGHQGTQAPLSMHQQKTVSREGPWPRIGLTVIMAVFFGTLVIAGWELIRPYPAAMGVLGFVVGLVLLLTLRYEKDPQRREWRPSWHWRTLPALCMFGFLVTYGALLKELDPGETWNLLKILFIPMWLILYPGAILFPITPPPPPLPPASPPRKPEDPPWPPETWEQLKWTEWWQGLQEFCRYVETELGREMPPLEPPPLLYTQSSGRTPLETWERWREKYFGWRYPSAPAEPAANHPPFPDDWIPATPPSEWFCPICALSRTQIQDPRVAQCPGHCQQTVCRACVYQAGDDCPVCAYCSPVKHT